MYPPRIRTAGRPSAAWRTWTPRRSQDVQEWYRGYYGPNNCVLSLAGDITPERALELVTKYFGGIPPGSAAGAASTNGCRGSTRTCARQMEDRVPQARIYRVYHAPAWRDADRAATRAVRQRAQRIAQRAARPRLVYDQELATAVTADVYPAELASLVVVTATVKDGVDPARVEREMDRVIADLLAQGPTEAELARARAPHPVGVRARRRAAGRLRRTLRHPGREHDLRRDGRRPISTGWSAWRARRPRRSATRAGRGSTRRTTRCWSSPFPPLQPGPTAVDRTILPPLGDAPDVSFPAVQRATLSNGLSVLLIERHTTPLVNMTLAVDAGYAADTAEKAGAASLALDLLDDGTTTRDTFQIVDELDALGRADHHRQLARPVVRAAAGARGQSRALARDLCGRRPESVVPAGDGGSGQAAAPGADRPGEGAAGAGGPARRGAPALSGRAMPTALR